MRKKYISKGEWFDIGTEASLIDSYDVDEFTPINNTGLFQGYREGRLDQEVCGFDEFDITETNEVLPVELKDYM